MAKWHIENVLAALRSVLRLLAALVDALDGPEEKKRFVSLSSKLQEVEGELVRCRDESPSEEGPAVPSTPGSEPEDPAIRDEAPPRP